MGQFRSANVAQPPVQGLVSPWCAITKEKSPQSLCIRSASGHTPSHCSAVRWFAQLQHADLLLPRRSSHAAASWMPTTSGLQCPILYDVRNAVCVQNFAICLSRKAARSLGHVIVSKWAIGATCVHIAGSHQLSTRPTQRSPDSAVSVPLCAITKCRGQTSLSP
jgi:hypothetical protein